MAAPAAESSALPLARLHGCVDHLWRQGLALQEQPGRAEGGGWRARNTGTAAAPCVIGSLTDPSVAHTTHSWPEPTSSSAAQAPGAPDPGCAAPSQGQLAPSGWAAAGLRAERRQAAHSARVSSWRPAMAGLQLCSAGRGGEWEWAECWSAQVPLQVPTCSDGCTALRNLAALANSASARRAARLAASLWILHLVSSSSSQNNTFASCMQIIEPASTVLMHQLISRTAAHAAARGTWRPPYFGQPASHSL